MRVSSYYDGKEQKWVAYSVGRGPETDGLFSIRTARLTWTVSTRATVDPDVTDRTVRQMNEIWAQAAVRFENTTGVQQLRDTDISNVIELQFLEDRRWPLQDRVHLTAQRSGSAQVRLPGVNPPVTLVYQQGENIYAVAQRLRDLAIAQVPGATAQNTYLRSGETRKGPVAGAAPSSYNVPAEMGQANKYHLVIGRGLGLATETGTLAESPIFVKYETFDLRQVRMDQLPIVAARFKDEYAYPGAEDDLSLSNIDVLVLPHKAVYSQQSSAANQDAGNDIMYGKGMSDAYRDSTFAREGNQLLPELANTLLLNERAVQPTRAFPNVAGHEAGHVLGLSHRPGVSQSLMNNTAPLARTVGGPFRLSQGEHVRVRRRSGTSRDGITPTDTTNPALLR